MFLIQLKTTQTFTSKSLLPHINDVSSWKKHLISFSRSQLNISLRERAWSLCVSFSFQTSIIFSKPAWDRLCGPFHSSGCKSEVVLLKLVVYVNIQVYVSTVCQYCTVCWVFTFIALPVELESTIIPICAPDPNCLIKHHIRRKKKKTQHCE